MGRLRRHYVEPFGVRGLWLAAADRVGLGAVTVTPGEVGHAITLRMGTSDFANYRGVMWSGEYDFPYPGAPRTIVDAGAYVGFASIWFAQRYPDATIVAVEADAENYAALCRNTRALPQVTPVHAALWNEPAELSVVDRGGDRWSLRTSDDTAGPRRGVVPAVTVDGLLEAHGLDRVDILKVDIEGAETRVFADADRWIDRIGAIVMEQHDRFVPGCSEAVRAAATGFDVAIERGEHLFFARAPHAARES